MQSNFLEKYPNSRHVGFGSMAQSSSPQAAAQNAEASPVKKNKGIDMMMIMQMKKDGVSQNIINALLADCKLNENCL